MIKLSYTLSLFLLSCTPSGAEFSGGIVPKPRPDLSGPWKCTLYTRLDPEKVIKRKGAPDVQYDCLYGTYCSIEYIDGENRCLPYSADLIDADKVYLDSCTSSSYTAHKVIIDTPETELLYRANFYTEDNVKWYYGNFYKMPYKAYSRGSNCYLVSGLILFYGAFIDGLTKESLLWLNKYCIKLMQ